MKKILALFCILMAFYAIYFPFSYFGKDTDKKEVRISHILVNTEEEANKVKQEIDNGKSFDELVKFYSTDEISNNINGDIGYAQRNRLQKNIEEYIFTANKNKISAPLHSKDGWHIVKVTDIKYYSDSENFKYNPYRYLINVNI